MNYLDGLQACPFCKNALSEAEVPGGKTRPACLQCGWIHWKNPIPTAVALIPVDNGVLLVKRAIDPQKGDWCLPGGYVDYRESPIETVVREAREETGLDIKVVRQLGLPIITESNHLVTFFLGEIIGGEMQAGDDAEELAIYTLETLPANIAFPQHRTKVEDYYAGRHVCPFGCTQPVVETAQSEVDNSDHCTNASNSSMSDCPITLLFTVLSLIYVTVFTIVCLLTHSR